MANFGEAQTVEFRDFAWQEVKDFVLPSHAGDVLRDTGAVAIMSVVAGGKGTICGYLEEWGVGEPTVSHTTRDPEPRDLIDPNDPESHPRPSSYHFVDHIDMVGSIMAREMLEVAFVHGEMYGTSLGSLTSVAARGRRPILDIDIQGVQHLQDAATEMPAFFIVPPSLRAWITRWSARDGLTLPEDKFQRRVESAKKECLAATNMAFDRKARLIINDDARLAARKVATAIKIGSLDNLEGAHLRLERFIDELEVTSTEELWGMFQRTS